MRWLALATAVVLVGCSSNGASNNDASGTGGTSGSGPRSCLDIRRCTVEAACADEACVTSCKQRGTADAIARFDALEACVTSTGCARNSPDFKECLCRAECRDDLTCTPEVEACLADPTLVDQVCENYCF